MSKAKILIVEDEFVVAMNLEAILEDRGHQSVGIAPDLDTALRLAGELPDLALVDINLRDGETGPIIAERLRSRGVDVLFVTANPRMLDRVPGATAIGVLTKPCDEEVIVAAVDYALSKRHGIPLPSPPAGLTLLRDAA
ncbi:MAG: response regulator [Alphaproteobacteria bacterium]|nr:response regulator [Alphaproteobacteria bacterium]MBU1516241.1 response regulator [Alphaproteobacteria bacterium]MBU2095778.1 response regulator [Alphaproteobacteria bacterium]MBU2151894.1 response regulator [Alphaproteobacteria bacterium]MBU2306823.1 response regulator [Alphaproteobacteria bacterium]